MDYIVDQIKDKKTYLCVGLDSDINKIPDHLKKFEERKSAQDFDKAAEDLRLATRHLGMIVGKVDVEELLGSIFNDFCIGK